MVGAKMLSPANIYAQCRRRYVLIAFAISVFALTLFVQVRLGMTLHI